MDYKEFENHYKNSAKSNLTPSMDFDFEKMGFELPIKQKRKRRVLPFLLLGAFLVCSIVFLLPDHINKQSTSPIIASSSNQSLASTLSNTTNAISLQYQEQLANIESEEKNQKQSLLLSRTRKTKKVNKNTFAKILSNELFYHKSNVAHIKKTAENNLRPYVKDFITVPTLSFKKLETPGNQKEFAFKVSPAATKDKIETKTSKWSVHTFGSSNLVNNHYTGNDQSILNETSLPSYGGEIGLGITFYLNHGLFIKSNLSYDVWHTTFQHKQILSTQQNLQAGSVLNQYELIYHNNYSRGIGYSLFFGKMFELNKTYSLRLELGFNQLLITQHSGRSIDHNSNVVYYPDQVLSNNIKSLIASGIEVERKMKNNFSIFSFINYKQSMPSVNILNPRSSVNHQVFNLGGGLRYYFETD